MTLEQLEKRVAQLETERKKTEKEITRLEKQVLGYEDALSGNQALIKEFRKEISKINASVKEVGQFKKELKTTRAEISKELTDASDGQRETFKKRLKELEDLLKPEQTRLEKELLKLREEFGVTGALQKELSAQNEEDRDLSGRIDSLTEQLESVFRGEEQREQLAKALDDSRAQMDKQISELVGDTGTALDQAKNSTEMIVKFEATQRKMEKAFEGILARDEKRTQEQRELVQKFAEERTDRERLWNEWEKRFKTVETQSEEIAARLINIETVELALKRAQGSFDDLVEKISRRVNEITEVQRLGEQRFRQEWSTFQADSQKRWSGQVLGQEEQLREAARQRERLAEQIAQVEETLKDLQDVVQHVSDQSQRYLQSVLEAVRDALSENERFLSSIR
ncbi:MAG: hypothetical protein DWG76_06945 [Chloroflexi bacterium]|nr:hypothetical protein [Chloroflexota bacterium]